MPTLSQESMSCLGHDIILQSLQAPRGQPGKKVHCWCPDLPQGVVNETTPGGSSLPCGYSLASGSQYIMDHSSLHHVLLPQSLVGVQRGAHDLI